MPIVVARGRERVFNREKREAIGRGQKENESEALPFPDDLNVPFGANLAERSISIVKVKLNTSDCFRSVPDCCGD